MLELPVRVVSNERGPVELLELPLEHLPAKHGVDELLELRAGEHVAYRRHGMCERLSCGVILGGCGHGIVRELLSGHVSSDLERVDDLHKLRRGDLSIKHGGECVLKLRGGSVSIKQRGVQLYELRGGVVPIEQRIDGLRELQQRRDVCAWRFSVREWMSGGLLPDLSGSDHVHELRGGYIRFDGWCDKRVKLHGVRVGYFV